MLVVVKTQNTYPRLSLLTSHLTPSKALSWGSKQLVSIRNIVWGDNCGMGMQSEVIAHNVPTTICLSYLTPHATTSPRMTWDCQSVS